MTKPKQGMKLNMKLIKDNLRAWRKQDLKLGVPVDFKWWLAQWRAKNMKVIHGGK